MEYFIIYIAVASLIYSIIKKVLVPIIITTILGIAISLLFFDITSLLPYSFYLLMIGILLPIPYVILHKSLVSLEKILIGLISLIVFIGMLFGIMQWPFAKLIGLLLFAAVILYIILVCKGKHKEVLSFTSILASIALVKFIDI